MAHSIKLERDGAVDSVSIYDTDAGLLLDYAPQSPSISQSEATRILTDGSDIRNVRKGTVTETIRVMIKGSSHADFMANVGMIETLLDDASHRRNVGYSDPIWLVVNWNNSGGHRSEVLHGRLDWEDLDGISQFHAIARITITRKFYWEDYYRDALYLKSSATPTRSLAVSITNQPGLNWFQIDAAEIEGSLPAALELRLKNTNGASRGYDDIYIGHYVGGLRFDDDTAVSDAFVLEGESHTWASGGSDVAAGGFSGTGYHTTGAMTTAQERKFLWPVSGNDLVKMGGRYFRLLAVFASTPPANTYVQAKVERSPTAPFATLDTSGEVRLGTNELQTIGVLRLPPVLANVPYDAYATFADMAVSLYVRNLDGAGTLSIDYLFLMPMDGFRHIDAGASGVSLGTYAANEEIVDNGMVGAAYSVDSGNVAYPAVVAWGNPLFAYPGKDNRYFVLHHTNGNVTMADTWDVQVYYRNRKMTI